MAGYLITDEEWAQYGEDINNFMNVDAGNQEIIWLRNVRSTGRMGDDSKPDYREIPLKGVFQYNEFRSWPINTDTVTGEIDKESVLCFLNNEYLRQQGYLNEHGQFKFKPSVDKFILNGVRYKSKGDSQTAQAQTNPLLYFMVLTKDYVESENTRY